MADEELGFGEEELGFGDGEELGFGEGEELGFGEGEELGFGEGEELGFDESFEEALVEEASSFDSYASNHFSKGADPNYTRDPIKDPLLPCSESKRSKILTSTFVIIQRFMGDAADPKKTTNLTKIKHILSVGIQDPECRDEVYCQMCKMLNQNPSRISSARGWILFSCLAGCFVPSDALHAAVEKFLERGPPGFRAYLTERMKRTKANGPRHQATSWMELNAVKMKKKLDIEVISMDKRKTVLQCDSATTAGELHAAMCDSLGLKGSDGFSFMVNFAGKIFAIRDPSHHIMDAVAQVEQAGKVKDGEEKDVHWKMYFRKEEVAAGFDVKADAKHTTLMYHQVIAGLKCGKYGVEADVSALANLCAQHFYVMYQDNMDSSRLTELIKNELVPDKILKKKPAKEFVPEVEKIHARAEYTKRKVPVESVQCDVVTQAIRSWPKLFTEFYESATL